jgi:hypothetical protein
LTQSHLKRHLRHERWHRQINSIWICVGLVLKCVCSNTLWNTE